MKYLPDFQLADPSITPLVTIGDLYAHRSGIPAGAGDDLEGIGFTRDQIVEKLRYFPLNPFRVPSTSVPEPPTRCSPEPTSGSSP